MQMSCELQFVQQYNDGRKHLGELRLIMPLALIAKDPVLSTLRGSHTIFCQILPVQSKAMPKPSVIITKMPNKIYNISTFKQMTGLTLQSENLKHQSDLYIRGRCIQCLCMDIKDKPSHKLPIFNLQANFAD